MYPCHKNARAAVIALIKWLIHASYLLYLYPESHIPEPQWPAVSVNSCGWVVHSCGLKHPPNTLSVFRYFCWVMLCEYPRTAPTRWQRVWLKHYSMHHSLVIHFVLSVFFTRMKCQGTPVETFPQSVPFVKWYQFTVVSYRNIICLWKMFEKVCFCP